MSKIVDLEGALIGDLTHLRVVFEDGRWVDRQVPSDKTNLALAAIFQTGIPSRDETNFKDIETVMSPHKIRCIVICKTDEAFARYRDSASLTRETIERGFISKQEAKAMRSNG